MKSFRPLPVFLLLLGLAMLGVPEARAQAILENGYRNVFGPGPSGVPGGVVAPVTNDPLLPAYGVQRQNGTAFGGFPTYLAEGGGYGTLQTNTQPPVAYNAILVKYPRSAATTSGAPALELRLAIIGRPLAVFNVSYNFGGEIPPPTTLATGELATFRAEPLNARLKTTVITDTTTGAETSRQEVNAIATDVDGIITTTNGTSTTTVTIGQNPQFYWSKHAQKVFATQPGAIEIQWRKSDDANIVRKDTYVIATAPDKQERTIFWTENGFNGPLVDVPAGRVNAVNIIYNTLVPKEVERPYQEPWLAGATDLTQTDPAKRRYKTFYYENNLIHAYNVQGRVFVEYLGNPRGDGTSEPKGTEIVNIIKESTPDTLVVNLGEIAEPLRPPTAGGFAGDLEARVIAGLGLSASPFLHQQISAGGTKTTLYAIRETQPGVTSGGQIRQVSNEVLVYWMETSEEGNLNLKWPKQYVGYVLEWPTLPLKRDKYSIYARPDSGLPGGLEAAVATAVQLDSANNPALVYQDDPANTQAVLAPGNKFHTKITAARPSNRALIRYTRNEDIWFERVLSQLDKNFPGYDGSYETVVNVNLDSEGAALIPGPITNLTVSDPNDPSRVFVLGTDYVILGNKLQTNYIGGIAILPSIVNLSYRAEAVADVGTRLAPLGSSPYSAYGGEDAVYVGYIHQPSGTAFDPLAYKDPFVAGFNEAAKGAIIPINALPPDAQGRKRDELEVWWYRKSEPNGTSITGTFWPSFVLKYKLRWPAQAAQIELASNKGSGDLPSLQATGEIYYQNDPSMPGYNPNEEHALMLNGRAWALRDDLNETSSSERYVLLRYTEADQRPAMRVFQVTRGIFDYPAVAGKVLQSPMPLPLLPPPLLSDLNRTLASYEKPGVPDNFPLNAQLGTIDSAFAHYQNFTWSDRKGILWVYRGPHQGNAAPPEAAPSLVMRYFYKTMPGFHFPSLTVANQPVVGEITPYLRNGIPGAYIGDPVKGEAATSPQEPRAEQPMDVIFRPQWPDTAPELRLGETLTLPKLGLPSVRGQASAEFIYQQSVANDNTANVAMAAREQSARLFDPTRAKIYPLSPSTLAGIPDSVNTSRYLGKVYFPNLPPHLSARLYLDPAIGAHGALVFKGVFMDEQVGEKYLQLNVMSPADVLAAKSLVPDDPADEKTKWNAAIEGLATTMETFIENPAKLGTFIPLTNEAATPRPPIVVNGVPRAIQVGALPLIATAPDGITSGPTQREAVSPRDLAEVFYGDTAVDSYAVSASGGGSGFVVLAVGNGRNKDFTPPGQPVSLAVFKVEAPLYRGELKVINSQNPLDEKLTLQHTGDFAGKPEEYDFEWRYAPPVDGLPPRLYSFVRKLIFPGAGENWTIVQNPSSNPLDPALDYTRFRTVSANVDALEVVNLPGQITINNGGGTAEHGTTLPHALLRRIFDATQRPLRLFLSLDLGANDGALVYLNGAPVASYRVPGYEDSATTSVPATAPAFDPLPLVFEINANALAVDSDGTTPTPNVLTAELFTTADAGSTTNFNLRLEGSQEVESLIGWLPVQEQGDVQSLSDESKNNFAASPQTTGIFAVTGKNRHTIQGTSILTLSDNWFIMRYRAKDPGNAAYVANAGWSTWTEPQLAEGWIKRVLAGINPFQQRVKDLFNNQINTSVSLVEQAGKRWEGNIALNLANINDSGLIEIYETVLNRGKDLSIDGTPAINYGGANDALLLAAGYLSDLYMVLGNEAHADAANSTIAFSTATAADFVSQYGDVATSLFAFKGQLASVLDEELTLLRGRDDSLLPGARKTPIYNRLIWNYTRGISSGEAIYALNYNIRDRTWDTSLNPNNIGNLPTDGIISAADAAISYPQGHGDAYGHYLTALKGYYSLLNNPNFSWTPRIEAVLVLGTPVSVDYQDERKFAAAAAATARSAGQILDLTYRQQYTAAENAGWSNLKDGKGNTNTGITRHWGTDDWACRGGQGALFHWITANSLLPAVDPDPSHSGIQKIDRTTVPELAEIAAHAAVIQQSLDNADGRLNPLGLAPGGLTFDISPSEVDAGKTHFEQIYQRATGALQNAANSFNNARGSTQFLRQQEDSLEDRRNSIRAQEQAYTNQLIELYGTPYTDDIGPGKTYAQDYTGPDLLHSMYVDITEEIGGFSNPGGGGGSGPDGEYVLYLTLSPGQMETLAGVTGFSSELLTGGSSPAISDRVLYTYDPISGELKKPAAWSGRRVSPGRMQTTVSKLLMARQQLFGALYDYDRLKVVMEEKIALYNSAVQARNETLATSLVHNAEQTATDIATAALDVLINVANSTAEKATEVGSIASTAFPLSVGTANDATSAARAAVEFLAATAKEVAKDSASGFEIAKTTIETAQKSVDRAFEQGSAAIEWNKENTQLKYELKQSLQEFYDKQGPLDAALRNIDQAQRDLYALQAEGDRIQQQRLVFRQHAAAIIQGFRTRDFAFRAFRDEALERYRALFDLSARYTYLAAQAYDYETGLLDSSGNASAAGFFEKIVQARALGVVINGQPQFAGASTGDPGLSGVLAALAGDWSVAKTRLGFNNPDRYATTFSLRGEKFRLVPGADGDLPWRDKLSGYRMANILEDADVKRYCMQVADPNGSAVPGIVIPFSSTIATGYNFFGQPLAGGDHTFTPSSFSTKIRSSGMAFRGYVGMDSPTTTSGTLGGIGATSPETYNSGFSDPNALSATPYIYLIPVGADSMRSPPLGDTSFIRTWSVQDQAIPLPFNIANSNYSTQPAWVSAASLTEPPFTLRKHQAFRAVPDGTNFQGGYGFTNARLIGRSAWNSQWKIVIPGNTLLSDPNLGIQTFINTVKDIKLHLETYSYSGN